MKINPLTLGMLFAALSMLSTGASADWAEVGVAYKCDRTAKTFSLVGTVRTSAPELPGEIPAPSGFHPLPEGKQTIHCKLGKFKFAGEIRVTGPRMGNGSGAGTIQVGPILVGNETAFWRDNFNNADDSRKLVRIEVRVQEHSLITRLCTAGWDYETGYDNLVCEDSEKPLPLPSLR